MTLASDSTSRPADRGPIDLTYRYDPSQPKPIFAPASWEEVGIYLGAGNHMIVGFNEACRRKGDSAGRSGCLVHLSAQEAEGEPKGEDGLPLQYPFVAVLGCSDARVPTEMLFGQKFNDIFNIRVAGNVLADEGLGSIQYALRSFVPEDGSRRPRGLKGVVVLGHRGCGAVKATVQAYQASGDPTCASIPDDPIGSILRRIADPPLACAVPAFDAAFGAGASLDRGNLRALAELVVYLNAAWVGREVRRWVDREGPGIASAVGVGYAVVDPGDLRLRVRPHAPDQSADCGPFCAPPLDRDELDARAFEWARDLRRPEPVPSP